MKFGVVFAAVAIGGLGWGLSNVGPAAVSDSPEWVPFAEAVTEANRSGKPSMVFIYGDQSHWCRKTFEETFKDETVIAYLEANFHTVKVNVNGTENAVTVNGGSMDERQLAAIFEPSKLPTFVFLDGQGWPIYRTEGFYDADQFVKMLSEAAGDQSDTRTAPVS